MASARELLGAGGPLARLLSEYEERPGQLSMTEAVESTLKTEGVLLCEAGPGTGKTLAYLVPAILSGKKVVVSTATRALQEQIVTHDLPLIRRALGLDPAVAVMKGLGNYVCRRRYQEFEASAQSLRPGWVRALGALGLWLTESDSGDISELAALPETDPVWREVTSSSDTRIGSACQYYDECFVTRMKRDAEAARLVIVNHHLFFADLALRGSHPGHVIPDYDAVVFDEAHQLEDVATDFFGVRVSRARLERMVRDTERALLLLGAEADSESMRRLVSEVGAASDQLWQELSGWAGAEARVTLEREAWAGALERSWYRLDNALEALAALAQSLRGRDALKASASRGATDEALDVSAHRSEALRRDLAAIIDGGPGRVTWLEVGARTAALTSSAVDLSPVFLERIFQTVPAVVLTSATLTSVAPGRTLGAFGYLRSRLGLSSDEVSVTELVVRSPFDFERRALLYTPDDLPPPSDPRFVDAAVERIAELIEITGGGAFVLTTSFHAMRSLHAGLERRLFGLELLVQGQAPKSALIARFRAAGNAVLVATLSFWEGVDVPGRALRLVVLDKIPFSVPTDPVVLARSRALEAAGGNAFLELSVPAAAITLKQGFGRLIRTRTDRGVVALLDARLSRRPYGQRLLDALPPANRTREIDEVRSFWTGN